MREDILQLLEQKTLMARAEAQAARSSHQAYRELLRKACEECGPPLCADQWMREAPAPASTTTFIEAIAFRERLEEECSQVLRNTIALLEICIAERKDAERMARARLSEHEQEVKTALAQVEKENEKRVDDASDKYSPLGVFLGVSLIPVALFFWVKTYDVWKHMVPTPDLRGGPGVLGNLLVAVLGLGVFLLGWVPGYALAVGLLLLVIRALNGLSGQTALREGRPRRETAEARWSTGRQKAECHLGWATASRKAAERWRDSLTTPLAGLEARRSRTCNRSGLSELSGHSHTA
jgi:FtsZ-binding cell division protein ZapB